MSLPRPPPVAAAGRGYARMGDSRAGQMLAAGREMLLRLPEPEHSEHHFVFDRDKYEFYTATTYTWLLPVQRS
jgi:hypothetical protein